MEALKEVSSKTWRIFPIWSFERDAVEHYWQTLYMADTLKYRISDVVDPSWYHAHEMIMRFHDSMYMVWDDIQGKIVCEFMLENFKGKAAQIHFSMHPNNDSKYSVQMATQVTDEVLNIWELKGYKGIPFLNTLYGLTPSLNRAARLFNQKVGFKTIGKVPDASYFKGTLDDVILTVKRREEE